LTDHRARRGEAMGAEHGHEAPDPAEPSIPGSTRGTADLSAVRRTDAIFDALAARRVAAFEPVGEPVGELGGEPAGEQPAGSDHVQPLTPAPEPKTGVVGGLESAGGDPAVRLLRALIADVDEPVAASAAPAAQRADAPAPTEAEAGTGAGTAAGAGPVPLSGSGGRRRGSRTIVALGVAGAVLASTGVAAAGGGMIDRSAPAPDKPGLSEDARTKAQPEPKKPDPAPAPVARPTGHERTDPKGTKDDPVRKQIEDLKQRLEDLLKPRPTPRGSHANPWQFPPPQHDSDDTRKKLEDIRRQAQKRIDKYRGEH